MDRRQGVRVRSGRSIEIDFIYRGVRCRETLKGLAPTKPNLEYAKRKRQAIQFEITQGKFNYAEHFPSSRKVKQLSLRTNITVSQALDGFLRARQRTCSVSTLRDYRSSIEFHLRPTFGDRFLSDITTADIREWIGGLTVSAKRINNVLIPLRAVLEDAFGDGLIDRNPTDRVRNLTYRFEEPEPFQPDEVAAILKVLTGQARNLVRFAFWTGLRTSELIGLEWGDVDFKRGCIRVRRATVRKHTKVPKTVSGERDVKLLPPALEALRSQRAFTFLQGYRVFHNPRTDSPWETDGQIRRTLWIPALRRAGVRYRNPYQTRHTYASTLLSAGENPLWVAQQMGHKDWGMIRKRYGRWIPDMDKSAGSKVIEFLSQHGHSENANV